MASSSQPIKTSSAASLNNVPAPAPPIQTSLSRPNVTLPPSKESSLPLPPSPTKEEPTSGLNAVITNLIADIKLGSLLIIATTGGSILVYYFGLYAALFGNIMLIASLTFVWKREISRYRTNVRAEVQRLNGVQLVRPNTLTMSNKFKFLNVAGD